MDFSFYSDVGEKKKLSSYCFISCKEWKAYYNSSCLASLLSWSVLSTYRLSLQIDCNTLSSKVLQLNFS